MAVYVDDWQQRARVGPVAGVWSHLTADSDSELHDFARRLGLRRGWFQEDRRCPWMNHYDVTESKRKAAIRLGAVPLGWRQAGERIAALAHAARRKEGP